MIEKPPSRIPLKRRLLAQALFWVALAALVRLAHMLFAAESPLFRVPTSDEYEHWELATSLAAGDWLGLRRGAYHRPQLFAYALAGLLKIFGGRLGPVHGVLALVDSLGVGLLWLAARRALSRRAAFWGATAAVTYWPFVHFSATLYMESFALAIQAGLLLALAAALRRLVRRRPAEPDAGQRPLPPPLFWAGALAGLALLTRPTVAITLPWVAALLFFAARRGGAGGWRAAAAPAVFAAMLLLTLLPNATRNYLVSGQWIWYSSNGALNFYLSNNAEGISWQTRSPGREWRQFIDLAAIEGGVGEDREARIEFWRQKSREYLRGHFPHFLANYYDKILKVWNARAIHCTNNFEEIGRLSPVQRALPGFGFWGALALPGLLLAAVRLARRAAAGGRRKISGARAPATPADEAEGRLWALALLGGYAVIYLFGVALFLAIERHRLPALAPLFLFAGLWIEETRAAFRAKRRAPALCAALALALAALFVNSPLSGPDLRNHERYWTQVSLGRAFWKLGRLEEARAAFREAHALAPNRLEPPYQLSLLEEETGTAREAARWQRIHLRALARDFPANRNELDEQTARLFVLELKASQLAEAEQTARALAARRPADAHMRHFLGVALMAQGRAAEAAAAFREALAMNPAHEAARRNLLALEAADGESSPALRRAPEPAPREARP